MLKTRVRVTSCVLWIIFTALGFYSPNPVRAETYTATQETRDFYFESQEPLTLTVRTYAQQYGIDSMLWLYNDQNMVVASNDDHFGLDSYISYQMQVGVQYRLRAGVCCGDPERWYGTSYVVDPSLEPSNVPVTTSTTTTTTTTLPLPSNANWSMVNENDTLELVAPNGFVFSEVLFASYGTPNGQNGFWTIGNCHAQNSVSLVEDYLLGRSFVAIPANNGVFGDPCGGTPKRLAVTALYAPAPSTTTTSTTTTTVPETTTTVPVTTTTQPVRTTTTTEPVQVVESTTTTSSSSTTSIAPLPPVVVQTTTTLPPQTTQAPTTSSSSIPPEVTTTTIPITPNISQTAAVAVATNPEVLQALSSDEAEEVFNAISESELTSEEAEQLVEAVQDAPLEVREQFESQINVFSGKFNSYVPIGSSINVGQRKVLIAASGLLFMAPTVPSTIGSSTSQSQSRRK